MSLTFTEGRSSVEAPALDGNRVIGFSGARIRDRTKWIRIDLVDR
jgi:hypothetical protein